MNRLSRTLCAVAAALMTLRLVVNQDDPSLAVSMLSNLGLPFLVVGTTLGFAARDDLTSDRDLLAAAAAFIATLALLAAGIAVDRHSDAAPTFLAVAAALFAAAAVALGRAVAARRRT
jgi:peptidoglycan/LPS O-acetylase OafA/YrhL